jgi:hypothetical protein
MPKIAYAHLEAMRAALRTRAPQQPSQRPGPAKLTVVKPFFVLAEPVDEPFFVLGDDADAPFLVLADVDKVTRAVSRLVRAYLAKCTQEKVYNRR